MYGGELEEMEKRWLQTGNAATAPAADAVPAEPSPPEMI